MEERPESTVSGRRRLLRAGAVLAAVGLAGCSGDGGGENPDSATTPGTEPASNETADVSGTDVGETTADPEETTTDGELDLREANVVGVDIEPLDGTHRFSVTLYHDDDGEDGYADWWQVETVEDERLGRRELLHAHGTAPFVRSETVDVPDGVACVVVRGHDQTHGYGGRAMLVNVETGASRTVRQGTHRRQVDPGDCP